MNKMKNRYLKPTPPWRGLKVFSILFFSQTHVNQFHLPDFSPNLKSLSPRINVRSYTFEA